MNPQHPQLVVECHEEGQVAALLTPAGSSLTLKDFYYHSPKARGEFREEVRTRMRGARETGCDFTGLAAGAGPSLYLFKAAAAMNDRDALVREIEQDAALVGRDLAAVAFAAGTGEVYSGTGDLLVATLPFRELDLLRELGKSMNCSAVRVFSAPLLALSAAARRSAAKTGSICVVGVLGQETRLAVVEKGGIVRLLRVPFGQQGIFEAIKAELALKFVGSAAKLVYDGVYDFSEVADKAVSPWADAVKQSLAENGLPGALLVHLLPPTSPWIAKAFARFVGSSLFLPDEGSAPAVEGELFFNPAQVDLLPMWAAVSSKVGNAPFGLSDWQAAKPLSELIASLPGSAKAVSAPAAKAAPAPAVKAAEARAKAPVTSTKPAASAKSPAAPAKATAPVKPAQAPKAKPPAPVAAKAQSAAVPSAAKPTPVAPVGEKSGESKKPPFVIIGAIAAVLFLGVILFFVFGRGGDSSEALVLTPAPAPANPVVAPVVAQPTPPASRPEPESPPPAPPPALLALTTQPTGASVSLNGRNLGSTPLSALELDPGTHSLEVALDGYAPQTVEVELLAGQTTSVEPLALVRLAGGLVIESRPSGAIVRRNGERVGRTPLELADLTPGPYTFSLEMEGFVSAERTVEIRHGETARTSGFELNRQTGSLVVESHPTGIRFRIEDSGDGTVQHEGATPMTLEALPTGSYRVSFERPDWPNFTRPARIQHGESTSVRMEYPEGRLRLASNPPGAEVSVEDRILGVTPLELEGLRPGRMALSLRLEGHLSESVTAEIEPNAETVEEIQLINLDRIFRPNEVDELPEAREQARPETNVTIMREESVMARFIVNQSGVPENIEIVSSTNQRLNAIVLETVQGWRFEPAKLRGENVRISLGAPFVFQPSQRVQDEE